MDFVGNVWQKSGGWRIAYSIWQVTDFILTPDFWLPASFFPLIISPLKKDFLFFSRIIRDVKNGIFFTVNLQKSKVWRCSMSYQINDDCISCGACQSECPAGAISEGSDKYVIDEGKCTDCGACADVCPVNSPNPA